MAGAGAEARLVDQALRVLDAKAHRERLGQHRHAALLQQREGVPRTVSYCQHRVVGAQLLTTGQAQAPQVALLDQQIGHLLAEADVAAQRLDLGPHLLDHAHQAEGADVRLGDVEDLLRRAGLDELGEHLARQVPRIADLAPQLAVAEGAGTPFAELHVRCRVEHAAAPQAPGVLRALAHRLAALQHDRPQAHLRQDQRREQAARPEADDHRPRLVRALQSPPARGRRSGSACRGRCAHAGRRPAVPAHRPRPRRRPAGSRWCSSAPPPTSCARPRRGGRPSAAAAAHRRCPAAPAPPRARPARHARAAVAVR